MEHEDYLRTEILEELQKIEQNTRALSRGLPVGLTKRVRTLEANLQTFEANLQTLTKIVDRSVRIGIERDSGDA